MVLKKIPTFVILVYLLVWFTFYGIYELVRCLKTILFAKYLFYYTYNIAREDIGTVNLLNDARAKGQHFPVKTSITSIWSLMMTLVELPTQSCKILDFWFKEKCTLILCFIIIRNYPNRYNLNNKSKGLALLI